MKKLMIIMFLGLSSGLIAQVTLKVNPDTSGVSMSPHLIGAFFEDINYAADGGLYAELIQNRSFEYYKVERWVDMQPLDSWELIGENAVISVEDQQPINAVNTHYLHLSILKKGQKAGFKNLGYDGISLNAGEKYNFSMYVRAKKKFKKDLNVNLVNAEGKSLASLTFSGITDDWQKVEGEFMPSASHSNCNLEITTSSKGELYFDMISLFPANTFKGRENGMRNDLAETIADLNPQFLRFPGGCVSHGRGLDNAYRWKETVGPVIERVPNYNLWGYHQTYGIGFYEYFQYCEDIGAIPLPVVPIGVSCQFRDREIAPIEDMQLWVDDALDLVEFANGSVESEWGKVRAEMGHPEPFGMEYLCLGNEEDDIPEVRVRMKMITDSLRMYYPEIKVIGTSGTAAGGRNYDGLWEFSRAEKLDAVDEHYYVNPSWMLNNLDRYDDFDRNGPKVFIGEYASRDDRLKNAIAEAAYLTGVEKNADVIQFTCYAPLLSNENHHQWNPDLIRFDNDNVVKTASYYVQQLYSQYTGDEYIPSTLSYSDNFEQNTSRFNGKIGVGTWATKAVFDDIKVETEEGIIFEQTFDDEAKGWVVSDGQFNTENGTYIQSSMDQPALSIFQTEVNVYSYSYTLRAKKTEGREGFLIPFAFTGDENLYWLNLGGWNNSRHAIQFHENGPASELVNKRGSIETNKWYDIKIEVNQTIAYCYLDGELLFEIPALPKPVSASVVKDESENELIIKLVNAGEKPVKSNVFIEGFNAEMEAQVITLQGDEWSLRNSLETPEAIKPTESTIKVGDLTDYELPARSFKVISIKK